MKKNKPVKVEGQQSLEEILEQLAAINRETGETGMLITPPQQSYQEQLHKINALLTKYEKDFVRSDELMQKMLTEACDVLELSNEAKRIVAMQPRMKDSFKEFIMRLMSISTIKIVK